MHRDATVNCTAVAVLHIPKFKPFLGHPLLSTLIKQSPQIAIVIEQGSKDMATALAAIADHPYQK